MDKACIVFTLFYGEVGCFFRRSFLYVLNIKMPSLEGGL